MSLDVYLTAVRPTVVYWRNITHNLGKMAAEAGIYEALWRPEEIGITSAEQLIPFLEKGLNKLQVDPEYYKTFNPENGWGSYEILVDFVDSYLEACRKDPDATITAHR